MSDVSVEPREDDNRVNSGPETGGETSSGLPDAAISTEARKASAIVDAKASGWNVVDALAFFYAQYGKFRHSRALYAALYAQFPENQRYGLGLASARLACEDYEGCLKLANYLATRPNPPASVFFLMARSHHALGHTKEAQEAVQAFLNKNEQQSKVPASAPAKNRVKQN
ncbi:hypothetical protein [Thalassospira sp.]|uniref:hypothetical protein n=1 Tax=Thalassospira sp. TaxID=1912094 RepID=UPI0025FE684A|nr:hypothetical protein [Thalassospira sp.]